MSTREADVLEKTLARLERDPERCGRVKREDLIARPTAAELVRDYSVERLKALGLLYVIAFTVPVVFQLVHRLWERVWRLAHGSLFIGEIAFALLVGALVWWRRHQIRGVMETVLSTATGVEANVDRSFLGKILAGVTQQHRVSRLELVVRACLCAAFVVATLYFLWDAPLTRWWRLLRPTFARRSIAAELKEAFFLSATQSMAILTAAFAWMQARLFLHLRAVDTPTHARLEPLPIAEATHEQAQDGSVRIVHWSDLHLCGDPKAVRIEGGLAGDVAFLHVIEHHRRALDDADAILVTGDITDAGRPHEWASFLRAMPQPLISKLVLVPGNHDINVTDSQDVRAIERSDFRARNLRILRMLYVLDAVQGDRASVIDQRGSTQKLRDYLRSYASELEAVFESPTCADTSLVSQVWGEIFPMRVEFADGRGSVLVMDSNDRARSVVDNALGRMDESSLARVASLTEDAQPGGVHVHALHHHVALAPELFLVAIYKRFKDVVFIPAMVLQNARALLSALGAGHQVIFHGHRHVRFEATLGGKHTVISAPSTTLGDEAAGIELPAFAEFVVGSGSEGVEVRAVRWHRCTRVCGLRASER